MSEKKSNFEVSIEDKVGIVKINRPDKMNAFTFEMFGEMEKELLKLNDGTKDIRAIVLTGNGKHFTSGLDLMAAA